jgi:hypothetical protein
MPTFRSLWRAWFHSTQLDRELDDELQAFDDDRTQWHLDRGRSPADARRAALLEVGGADQVNERTRQAALGASCAASLERGSFWRRQARSWDSPAQRDRRAAWPAL